MRTFHFFDVRDLLKLFQQKNPSIVLIPGTSFYEASLPILPCKFLAELDHLLTFKNYLCIFRPYIGI